MAQQNQASGYKQYMFEPGALVANIDTKENLETLLKNKFLDKTRKSKISEAAKQHPLSTRNAQSLSPNQNSKGFMPKNDCTYSTMNNTFVDQSRKNNYDNNYHTQSTFLPHQSSIMSQISNFDNNYQSQVQFQNTDYVAQNIKVEQNIQSIPRTIYVSSKNTENKSLGNLRDKMRRNNFLHHEFDTFIQSKQGMKYFKGVHLPNQVSPSKIRTDPNRSIDQIDSEKLQELIELESNCEVLDVIMPHHQKYQKQNIFNRKKEKVRHQTPNPTSSTLKMNQIEAFQQQFEKLEMINLTQNLNELDSDQDGDEQRYKALREKLRKLKVQKLQGVKVKEVVDKSIKKIFDQFKDIYDFSDNTNEGQKFDEEKAKRLMKIADEEFKKFMPHWIAGSFRHYIQKQETKIQDKFDNAINENIQDEEIQASQPLIFYKNTSQTLLQFQDQDLEQINENVGLEGEETKVNNNLNATIKSRLSQYRSQSSMIKSRNSNNNTIQFQNQSRENLRSRQSLLQNQKTYRGQLIRIQSKQLGIPQHQTLRNDISQNNKSTQEQDDAQNQNTAFRRSQSINQRSMNWKQKLELRRQQKLKQASRSKFSSGNLSATLIIQPTKEEIQRQVQENNQRLQEKLAQDEIEKSKLQIDFLTLNKIRIKEISDLNQQQISHRLNSSSGNYNSTIQLEQVDPPATSKNIEPITQNKQNQLTLKKSARNNNNSHSPFKSKRAQQSELLRTQRQNPKLFENSPFKTLIQQCIDLDLPDQSKLQSQYNNMDYKQLKLEELKQQDLIKAIDTCLLAQVEDNDDMLPTLDEAIAQNKVQDGVTYDTFLDQHMLQKNRDETDQRIILLRNLKVGSKKLWKPDKLRVTKHLKMKFSFLNEK
eukprot:403351313